ncbi:10963_t:CDS:1, partial [Racocetra fulgida]
YKKVIKKGKLIVIEKNLKDFEKYRKELRKNIRYNEEYKRQTAELEKKYIGNLSNRSFITIAKDLKCLKESLIEEL